MRKFFAVVLSFLLLSSFAPESGNALSLASLASDFVITEMKVNNRENPIGIELENVRFSWKIESEARGVLQESYKIIVEDSEGRQVWDSGEVLSREQNAIVYEGEKLGSKTAYNWTLKLTEKGGAVKSQTELFETGVENWEADWIGGANIRLLKNVLSLPKPVSQIKRARAYIIGEGMFELTINQQVVGDSILTPPSMEYFSRGYYLTYEIEKHLKEGDNSIGIMLTPSEKGVYYDNICIAKMEMDIEYNDNTAVKLRTNEQSGWFMTESSPITRETYFKGEDQDRTKMENWNDTSRINVSEEWEGVEFDGTKTVADGLMQIVSNVDNKMLLKKSVGEEFILEMRVKVNEGGVEPAVGVLFGYQNDSNFNMWQTNFHYNLYRPHMYINGAWDMDVLNTSAALPASIKKLEFFDFKLEVTGGQIKTYYNNELFATVNKSVAEGKIGFKFAGGNSIILDNIKVTENGAVTIEDDFSVMGAWRKATTFKGNVIIENEALKLIGANTFSSETYSDFDMSLDVTVQKSAAEDAFGLYFRKGAGTDAYMWQVNLSLMQLRPHVLKEGKWDVIKDSSISLASLVKLDESFNFRLCADGSLMKTYINGELVSSVSDATFKEGRIGFRLEAGETNIIDNVVIKSISGETLLQDSFSSIDEDSWKFPTRFNPKLTALNTFTRIKYEFEPKTYVQLTPNKVVIDFGQNMAGFVKLLATGERGSKVKVSYAEHLAANGDICGDTVSGKVMETGSEVYNEYTLAGTEEKELFCPKFTYTGYQYVSIETTGEVSVLREDIKGCYITEDMEQSGEFESSNETINGVMDCYIAAQDSNSVGNFLASPHREKDGWIGDNHVTNEAVNYIYDSQRLYENYFNSMNDNTYEGDLTYSDGLVRVFVPHIPTGDHSLVDIPWQSGKFTIVWDLYEVKKDKTLLENSYDKMKLTIEYFRSQQVSETNYRIDKNAFGDWLGFDNRNRKVSKEFLSTAYYYRSVDTFAKIAAELNNQADKETYENLAVKIAKALNDNWLKDNSYYDFNTQSSNAIALYLGFVPSEAKSNVINSLVKNVEEVDYAFKGGMLAAKAIYAALAENGRSDVAALIAANDNYGSLGYMWKNGATTLWEYWEEYGQAFQFGPEYQSLNHNMYGGGFATFCYKELSGLVNITQNPVIKPANNMGVMKVSASTQTISGKLKSSWENTLNEYKLDISVPANSESTIYVPAFSRGNPVLKEGDNVIYSGKGVSSADVTYVEFKDDYFKLQVGSGDYSFTVTGTNAPAIEKPAPFDTSIYKMEENKFNNNTAITEITTEENIWKFENGVLKMDNLDTDHVALFGTKVDSKDFVYSGKFMVKDKKFEFWSGIRLIIGYENPTLFDVVDIQAGGIFYSRRNQTSGWDVVYSMPHILYENKEYTFEIKVIDGCVYFELDGKRFIDGYKMEYKLKNGFGVFASLSEFEMSDIKIGEIKKPIIDDGGNLDEDDAEKMPPKKGLADWQIALISVGGGVAVIIGGLTTFVIIRKKKIKK